MEKILFYGMTGEKTCFLHILLNAIDLSGAGADVKVIFEGASVKVAAAFEKEKNPLYQKAKEQDLIAGVCEACSKMMGVYEANRESGLVMLKDMSGHAGMKPYIKDGYLVVSM